MKIPKFKKKLVKFNISVPETGFRPEEQVIEIREDQLTGGRCRINILRKRREMQPSRLRPPKIPVSADADCPFCADNIEERTPKFFARARANKVKEGRMRLGNSVLFPNRYGYSTHHAIVTITNEHFIPMDQIKVVDIQDAFMISVQYLKMIGSNCNKGLYAFINWNYMPPSGASIIHPHLQVIADENPTKLLEEILERSFEYYQKNTNNYWLNLIDVERKLGERFIGEDEFTVWVTSYAPSGNNEVIAFLPSISSLGELRDKFLYSLANGIKRLMSGYARMGINSFNMSTYSGETKSSSSCFTLHFKFISRPNYIPYYTNDRGFMETLQFEPVIEQTPEATAEELRTLFQDL